MNFTFLTREQVLGENKLEIFNKYSVESMISDFALLLGGTNTHYIKGVQQQNPVSWWWTKTATVSGDSVAIKSDDLMMSLFINHRDIGVRPAFCCSDITCPIVNYDEEYSMIYYGEYPQTVVSLEYAKILENAYHNNKLKLTGKTYTTDLSPITSCIKKFDERTHIEYEYGGKKYIRMVSDETRYYQKLSNDRIIRKDEVYWIEVEPVKWLIDNSSLIAFSENILFSGIQFNNERNYTGDFDTTDIKKYMDKYFSKDLIPSVCDTIEKSSREEYIHVLNQLTTNLYKKTNKILNVLLSDTLKGVNDATELALEIQNILDKADEILKTVYNSQYISRTKVIEYFENQINNLDIIERKAENLNLDIIGLGVFKLSIDEYCSKRKLKKATYFVD